MQTKSKWRMFEIYLMVLISFSPLIPNIIRAGLILLMILFNIKLMTTKINTKVFLVLALIMSFFILSSLYDIRNVSSIAQYSILNLYFPLCFFSGYIMSEKYNFSEYLILLEKIIFVFAVLSLIGVFIYTFVPEIIRYLPSYQYYDTRHKTAFIFNIILSDGYSIKRNAGITWEPGAFQFIVNLGLYAYLKTNKKINLLKIAIYTLTVMTTKSTAGLLIFLLITIKLLMTEKKARILILLSLFAFSGMILGEFRYQYKYKLFGSYAFISRLEPLINSFNVGKAHFLGMGNSGYNAQLNYLNIGTWDSFGQIFIRYGYPMFITIIFLLSRIFSYERILFFILFITFLSQGIWYFPLVTPFYFMWRKCSVNTFKTNLINKKIDLTLSKADKG